MKMTDTTKVGFDLALAMLCHDVAVFSVIYPVDFQENGHIVDDVRKRALFHTTAR
jgi:hypothetical protein